MTIDTSKTYTATVKTDVGTFVIALDAKEAPSTVNNFVFLAEQSYFNCVIFHRVIPGFMDQRRRPDRHRAAAARATSSPTRTLADVGVHHRRRGHGQLRRDQTPTAASSSSWSRRGHAEPD